MKKKVHRSTDRFTEARRFNKVWRGIATALAALVIFGTVSALVLPAITQQTEDPTSIYQETDKKTVSGDGIRFRLFDYSQYINLSQPDVDGTYANRQFRPISNYFNFWGAPFALGTGASFDEWFVNKNKEWDASTAVYDADGFRLNHMTVERLLGADGYPILDVNRNAIGEQKSSAELSVAERSLAYLFGGVADHAVTEYPVTNTILQKGEDGHYFYDSALNAVDYDKIAQVFRVRGYAERGTNSARSSDNLSDFLPFNYTNGEVLYPAGSAIGLPGKEDNPYTTVRDANVSELDVEYWFGMSMEVNFFQAAGGTIDNEEMIFEFSGDDDVWVFIDDVLVLDLGGTHGVTTGSINFATGEVKQYLDFAGAGEDDTYANNGTAATSFPTSIYECFQKAGAIPNGGWIEATDQNGAATYTFSDYSTHTLKFFYMERGGAQSNCSIDFVLPTIPESSLTVSKELTTDSGATDAFIDGTTEYQFRVVKVDDYGEASDDLFIPAGTKYDLLYDGKSVGTGEVGPGGVFKLRSKESAQFTNILSLGGGCTAYMVQEIIPDEHLDQYTGVDYVIDGVVGSLSTQAALSQVYSAYSDVIVNSDPILLSTTTTGTASNTMTEAAFREIGASLFIFDATIINNTGADFVAPLTFSFDYSGSDAGQYGDAQILTFYAGQQTVQYYASKGIHSQLGTAKNWTTNATALGYTVKYSAVKCSNNTFENNGTYLVSTGGSITITISGTANVTYPVTGITLDKNAAELTVGNSTTLTATVNPANATNKTVTWSSSNEAVAKVDGGVVTAIAPGTATITVTTADGGYTATCEITVKAAPVISATGVTLDKSSVTLTEGSNSTLTATVAPADATNKAVTWKSSDASVVTVADGKIIAVKAGTATITVTTADGGYTATCTVTVTEKTSGNSISQETAMGLCGSNPLYIYNVSLVDSSGTTLTDKLTFSFDSASYSNDIAQQLTFSSFGDTVEFYTDYEKMYSHLTHKEWWTIDPASMGYSIKSVAATKCTTSSTVNGMTVWTGGTVTITLTYSGTPVTGVAFTNPTGDQMQLLQGTTAQLAWTLSPSTATYQNVTFTSSDPTVATVDANGLVSALKNGTTTITITTKDGGFTDSFTLTVGTVALNKVTLADTSVSVGKTLKLTPVLDPANASVKSMAWTSSNTGVATIDATTGDLTALALGKTTITLVITCYDASGNERTLEATCVVEVTPIKVEGVSLNKTKYSFAPGETLQLTATVRPSNAADQTLIWSTGNDKIATVENGLVTAVGVGTTNITVTTKDGNFTATCTVTVQGIYTWDVYMVYTKGATGDITITNPGISAWGRDYTNQSLTFSPAESLTVRKELKVLDTFNWLVDESKTWCGWTESNSAYSYQYIVTSPLISNQYQKHGVLYVVVDGGNGSSVDAQQILLNRTEVHLRTDRTIQLTATLIPNPTNGGSMTWSSSNSNIVSVTQNGKITGVSEGTATITVSYGSLYAQCQVTVYQGADSINGWIGSTPAISVGNSHLVVFRNKVDTSNLSTLVIEKNKADDASFENEATKEFTIKVLLGGKQLPVGTKFYRNNAVDAELVGTDGLIKLKIDDVVHIPGILIGTTFEVREEIDGKFSPSYQVSSSTGKSEVVADGNGTSGTFALKDVITTVVTNDSIHTKVEIPINKLAVNNASSNTFEFLVDQVTGSVASGWTSTGTSLPGTQITVTNDQLTAGMITISFKGQLNGTQYYKISEKNTGGKFDYDETYYIVGVDASDETPEIVEVYKNGTTAQSATNALSFVNYRTVDLVITKEVLSTKTSETFDFTVTFDSVEALANVNSTGNYTVSGNTITFSLGHGKDVVITGIRYGSIVQVTETPNSSFIAKHRINNATVYRDGNVTDEIALDQDSTAVHYQNSLAVKMPSTGGFGATPYILLGSAIVLISIVCGYVLWRKRERRFEA